ncbi:MAG: alpha-L-rhamnosidase C-terminal domain-containing protein [Rikenellaceae bacterium]
MRLKQLIFIIIIIISNIVCAQSQPQTLRVDYIRTPQYTLINSDSPIFSWEVTEKSGKQSAYQIVVTKGDELVWDSGKVESANNFAVMYGGKPLTKGERYSWSVRYWSADNKDTKYSKSQNFSISSDNPQSAVTNNPTLKRVDRATVTHMIAPGEYLFDFERSAFGSLNIEINAKEDATIVVRVGEQLTSEGVIERKPRGTIRYQEISLDIKKGKSTYAVPFTPDKRNTGHMAIPTPEEWGAVIMPFRYAEVCRADGVDVKSAKLSRNVWHGYREDLGSFSSSNSLLDSIWEISRYTIEATDFLGYYIDGDRERIPYEADAYINQLCHYCVDSEYAIGKKSLEYFMSHATWPTEWLLHTIMIAYQDYIYTGDTRLISKYYDTLKAKTLHELSREDGLISAKSERVTPEYLRKIGFQAKAKRMEDIVDWPKEAFTKGAMEMGERDSHDMVPINTVVNCFFFNALTQMSELASAVDNKEDSKYFAALSSKVKQTINTKLFDPDKGIYIDGEGSSHSSLHSNMMALAFDIVEEESRQSVTEFVKSRGLRCSVYGAQYLFEALYKGGEEQYALDLMTNQSDRSWYNMIRIGSTMTLEAWDIKYKGNLDWNHAWGAAPANLIPRQMWGITPSEVGYHKAMIKPQLADLEHSQISIPTLQGVIRAKYKRDGNRRSYEIYIPANMKASFQNVYNNTRVTLNGESIDTNVAELLTGKNIIKIIEL